MAEKLILANTAWKRLRGLLGRTSLAPSEAIWLRPCRSVHTFWMLFAIDVLFLDRQLRIVKCIENLRPFRMTLPAQHAVSVIELPAHTISQHNLCPGDVLRVEK
ncbi:MAG TPA: DUF192 domain-containing protein [Blastocatellia bacterium]|nr:DUF192 domain-containing protein [Blastocatellia bacterium]